MKFATTVCLVLLVVAVRSTGALQMTTHVPVQQPIRSGNDEEAVPSGRTGTAPTIPDATQPGSEQQMTNPETIPPSESIAPSASNPGTTTNPGSSSGSSGGAGGSTGGGAGAGSSGGTGGTPTVTYKFRNGTYSALGSYSTPGGTQSINVTLVVTNDVIVDSEVTGNAKNAPSKKYQQDFISHYKQYVVGQKIDQLNLAKVASSSLTPIGFNNATDAIENQARL